MRALTDSAPLSGKPSAIEAFLLWVAKSAGRPDVFQHLCVFIKYPLRGAALQHCKNFLTPARTLNWCGLLCLSCIYFLCVTHCHRCTKYMGALGLYGWTWLVQEKAAAAFFAKIEPHIDTVKWPAAGWDPVEVFTADAWMKISKLQLQALLDALYSEILSEFGRLGIPLLSVECVVKDQPTAKGSRGNTEPCILCTISMTALNRHRHFQ